VQGRARAAGLGREAVEEVVDEGGDVAAPVSQRRHPDLDDVEPIVEVLAEAAGLHLRLQVAVGGGDDAGQNSDVGLAAHAPDLPLLEGPEQLHLDRRRQVADLVEEQRPRARHLEEARLGLAGTREAPLLVAEELALEEPLWNGAAVDGHEGLVAAVPAGVDGPGHDLLAGAALPGDQHRGARLRHLLDELSNLADGRRVAQHLPLGGAHASPVAEHPVLGEQGPVLQRLLHHQPELVHLEGLQDVVVGAELHRLDRVLGGGEGCHHDHLGGWPRFLHGAQQVDARLPPQPEIGEDHVDRRLGCAGQGAGHVGGGRDVVPLLAEQDLEELPHRGLVVDDEDRGHGGILARNAGSINGSPAGAALGRRRRRQPDGEARPGARRGVHRHRAAVRVDDPLHGGQAQAAALRPRREEGGEEAREVVGGDARPVVLDLEDGAAVAREPGAHPHPPRLPLPARRLGSVEEQVPDHLAHLVHVAPGRRRPELRLEAHPRRGRVVREDRQRLLGYPGEVGAPRAGASGREY
jgi:hypothetical protein